MVASDLYSKHVNALHERTRQYAFHVRFKRVPMDYPYLDCWQHVGSALRVVVRTPGDV